MKVDSSPAILEQKKEFRARALRIRDELTPELREEKSRRLIRRIFDIPAARQAGSWFVYVSFSSEVQTMLLIRQLLETGSVVCVPQVDRIMKTMAASRISDPGLDLAPGFMGIQEPLPGRQRPVAADQIDIVIVPGAAFAMDGSRIGYGGGYYDRFLSTCGARTVGLAFEAQIFEQLPHDPPRDIRMDYIVTESRIIGCKAGS